MKKLTLHLTDRTVPVLLALVTLLSYGLVLTRLGFYWDDWAFAFLSHFYGPAELIKAFSAYRPFLGPIFFLTTTLFDSVPLLWQLFGLVIRFTTAFACWWMLLQIWPNHKNQILAVTLIFLVYPGYSQQWVALTHTNQELIPLIAYLFSIGLTARAIRNPSARRWNTILALLLQVIGLFTTEYFVGFEVIRLGVILILTEPGSFFLRLKRSLLLWLPYVLVWLVNGAWLFSFYRSGQYQSYGMEGVQAFNGKPIQVIGTLLTEAIQTIITASLYAWNQVFNLFRLPAGGSIFLTGLGILILGFLLVGAFRLLVDFAHENEDDNRWTFQAIALGIVAILVGRLPSWVAGLPFLVKYDYDRFFLSIMLGASLLMVGVLELIIKSGKTKVFFVSLLVALAICTQFLYAKNYQKDAENQKDFLAQLVWRAPAIEPGTILLTDKIPAIPHESDMGLSAALNWVYAPELTSHQLPLIILYSDIRLESQQLPSLNPGQAIKINYRTAEFNGNTTDSIVFYYPEVGCIKWLDPSDRIASGMIQIPPSLTQAALLSDLGRIQTSAKSPIWPVEVLGKEPKQTWCFYYQQAQLARQGTDWERVSELAQQALKAGLRPKDPTEWFTFVEADFRLDDISSATALMDKYAEHRASTRENACRFIPLLDDPQLSLSQSQFLNAMRVKFTCLP